MNSLERRLLRLENTVYSLKASYSTAGSLVKFYRTAQTFSVAVPARSTTAVRIKFSPTYGRDQASLTSLVLNAAIVSDSGSFSRQLTEIQDGSGDIVAQISLSAWVDGAATFSILATALGTSPGKFSML